MLSSRSTRTRRVAAFTTLALAGLLAGLLSGCGSAKYNELNTSTTTTSSANAFAGATGNWKFTTGSLTQLPTLAGSVTVTGSAVSATLHPLLASCAPPTDILHLSGKVDTNGLLTITSADWPDGQLSISGTLSSDRHSLANPSITVTNGVCDTPAPHTSNLAARVTSSASAQQYQAVTGNYAGSFVDSDGASIAVSATLSQPTAPDANGVYHLTGYATFPDNPCLTAPVITDSTVTGDSIQTTYTDSQSGAKVVATGTFSPDAQTLTLSNWTLAGCGDDTGTGLLIRQTS